MLFFCSARRVPNVWFSYHMTWNMIPYSLAIIQETCQETYRNVLFHALRKHLWPQRYHLLILLPISPTLSASRTPWLLGTTLMSQEKQTSDNLAVTLTIFTLFLRLSSVNFDWSNRNLFMSSCFRPLNMQGLGGGCVRNIPKIGRLVHVFHCTTFWWSMWSQNTSFLPPPFSILRAQAVDGGSVFLLGLFGLPLPPKNRSGFLETVSSNEQGKGLYAITI